MPGDDLIAAAVRRLTVEWGIEAANGAVRLQHQARAVFDVVTPGGEAAVVKVMVDVAKAERELLALRAAAAGGVAVPDVLAFLGGAPAVLVLGLVAGQRLGGHDAGAAWALAGAELARLHAVVPPAGIGPFGQGFGPVGDGADTWPAWLGQWLEHERGRAAFTRRSLGDEPVDRALMRVTAALADMEPPTTGAFLHGDLQPDHVLLGEDRRAVSGLIDFGDAGTGDPAFDLAILTTHAPHRLDDVVAGYQPGAAFHRHLARVIDTYQLLRLLGEVPWLAEHGFDPGGSLNALRARMGA